VTPLPAPRIKKNDLTHPLSPILGYATEVLRLLLRRKAAVHMKHSTLKQQNTKKARGNHF